MKPTPQTGYYQTSIYTGFVLLVISCLVLLAALIYLPSRYLKHEYESIRKHEEWLVLNASLGRLEEESGKLNEIVVRSNNELNSLIRESHDITNRISNWLEISLSNPAVRDSIDIFYQRQTVFIEPAIDSVHLVFEENTDRLVDLLRTIRTNQKELSIAGTAQNRHDRALFVLLTSGIFTGMMCLAGILTGIAWIRSGRKKWKIYCQELADPSTNKPYES